MDHGRHARPAALSMALWYIGITGALAQNAALVQPFVEEQRQQERQRALRENQERSVNASLPDGAQPASGFLPTDEAPCFRIERLELDGPRAVDFQWALAEASYGNQSGEQVQDNPIGRCLGTQGVNLVLARLQQALIARGWITSRVLAAPQDLRSGTLRLTLVPGRIAAIRFVDGDGTATATDAAVAKVKVNGTLDSLRNALPMHAGDLLNLRDVEQGLENLKRLPTAEADIQIEPSQAADAAAGDSDLVVRYRQRFPLRVSLSLDDSGTRSTGKNQAGVTLAWDGPLTRVVQAKTWTVQALPEDQLRPKEPGRVGGPFENWLMPLGDTGYTMAIEMGANQESLKYPQAQRAVHETLMHLVESLQVETLAR